MGKVSAFYIYIFQSLQIVKLEMSSNSSILYSPDIVYTPLYAYSDILRTFMFKALSLEIETKTRPEIWSKISCSAASIRADRHLCYSKTYSRIIRCWQVSRMDRGERCITEISMSDMFRPNHKQRCSLSNGPVHSWTGQPTRKCACPWTGQPIREWAGTEISNTNQLSGSTVSVHQQTSVLCRGNNAQNLKRNTRAVTRQPGAIR